MNEPQVSIALVDDHPVVLEGVAAVFSADPHFRVVAKGSSANDARAIAETHCPDIILMDISMPGDVFSAITEISHNKGETKVIVFTAFSSVNSAMKALDAGAIGFVLKGATCGELFEAVASALRGEIFVAREYASQMLIGLRNKTQNETTMARVRLNVREKQIIDHLLHARTNREIADSLTISEKTVKRYMTALMLKLHARNRVEVAIQAQRIAGLA